MKCCWGAMGIKPNTPQEFFLDGKLLEEASMFLYVGVWHDLKSKDMYAEHHRIYLEKAERISNACLDITNPVCIIAWDDAKTDPVNVFAHPRVTEAARRFCVGEIPLHDYEAVFSRAGFKVQSQVQRYLAPLGRWITVP
ncbi:hypothetical protein B0H13DRAFT_1887625 [Mycena leptocephala]|nr:hypothetical protein B0H13DRAFT_1887625 [Mycena leptocephala]